MRKIITALLLIGFAATSGVAQSKETRIRCRVVAKVLSGNPELDDRLNSQGTPATRHYVLDEEKPAVWSEVDGERRSACGDSDYDGCHVVFGKTLIAAKAENSAGSTTLNIDRTTGELMQTMDLQTKSGTVHFTVTGPCTPESVTDRKF